MPLAYVSHVTCYQVIKLLTLKHFTLLRTTARTNTMHASLVCMLVLALATLGQSYYYPSSGYGYPPLRYHADPVYRKSSPPGHYPIVRVHSIDEFLGKFVCKDGNKYARPSKISTYEVCDGNKDCIDGSDESMCGKVTKCSDGFYKCKNDPKCIPLNLFCDNKQDCFYGDDELNCPFVCSSGYYKCKGEDKCVRSRQVCDRKADCLHADDESNCQSSRYICAGGEVSIAFGLMCNGKPDCPDADDEDNCETARERGPGAYCPDEWFAYNGACYYLDLEFRTFDQQVAYCTSLNSKLVEIENSAEHEFLISLVEKIDGEPYWRLGVTDRVNEGVWRYWSSGEPATYLPFAPDEPSGDDNGGGDCLEFDVADDYTFTIGNVLMTSPSLYVK